MRNLWNVRVSLPRLPRWPLRPCRQGRAPRSACCSIPFGLSVLIHVLPLGYLCLELLSLESSDSLPAPFVPYSEPLGHTPPRPLPRPRVPLREGSGEGGLAHVGGFDAYGIVAAVEARLPLREYAHRDAVAR